MPVRRNQLSNADDLFAPDYNQNIYKVFPTALRCMGIKIPRRDLFPIAEVKNHLKRNEALKAKRVICCFVDSLGIENIKGTNLEKTFQDLEGVTLSSTFPTITSTAVTSFHHGVPPLEHGIVGHQIYFPEYDAIVDTLRMAGQGIRMRDAISRAGINVRKLLWTEPISDLITNISDPLLVYADGLPAYIAGTGLGQFFTKTGSIVPYTNLIDAFGMTRRIITKFSKQPLFVMLYFGFMDDLAHKYGSTSIEYHEGCNAFIRQLRAFVNSLPSSLSKETTICLCSDHGQNQLREDRQILFTEDELKEVQGTLLRPPSHSGRVMHFYCAGTTKRRRLKRWLQNHVDDCAVIFDTKDIDQAGLFSKRLSRLAIQRLGNLLLIARDGASAKVERDNTSVRNWGLLPEFKFEATHGSLTSDELFTPFLAFNASKLR
jgi:hypothetical protein